MLVVSVVNAQPRLAPVAPVRPLRHRAARAARSSDGRWPTPTLRPDEYAVYSVLFDEGPQTPSDLARRVGMPPTTMSHFVRALLERDHAARETVSSDRRSYRLALTPAGLAVARGGRVGRSAPPTDGSPPPSGSTRTKPGRSSSAIGQAAVEAEAGLAADAIDATA